MSLRDTMPYRRCVGVMLLNADNHVWVGRRHENLIVEETIFRWQMPQGGIDPGEEPRAAAVRELFEETGARSAEIIAESGGWLTYDLPEPAIGVALKGKYRGQTMKWFAMRFTGDEAEFDISRINDTSPEFDAWRWVAPNELAAMVVPFKRLVYEAVVAEFADILQGRTRRASP
ncbi:MAG: RNA pyrophosphohydrolase [Hyphomicrobiales bacterium]|nr:RNA pyrophosphohydrolase [Hyphomicrobiales bacterium]